ncbi:unnamed protein product [Ambrosiozyma monospora]|uniref:Unnamed protein product n=1 Tax=Ambrosiozyma monospora TaxID=43982 RepID=A0A9W6WJH3_AMBMO|nr:unnamed protein product [Ambrosiozyma monospora]
MKTRHLVEHIGSQKQETYDLSSITAEIDAEMGHSTTTAVAGAVVPYVTYDSFPEFKIYSDATDLALMDLTHKYNDLHHEFKTQQQQLSQSQFQPQPQLHTNPQNITQKELTQFQTQNEKWIFNWFSVLYGLFNADVTQLQTQLYGLNNITALSKLEETGQYVKDEASFVEGFVVQCKETCLSLLKELSLLLFEFYLLDSGSGEDGPELDQEKIMSECERRINDTVLGIFVSFRKTVQGSELDEKDKSDLKLIVGGFEEKLKGDLGLVVRNFNAVFKRNIDDFYVVFGAIKELKEQWGNVNDKDLNQSSGSDEDGNEFGDDRSVISVHSTSDYEREGDGDSSDNTSWSFDHESSSNSGSDSSVYKPLKLVEKRRS